MPRHSPILFDAADTSSFTLTGQRENIEGVEVDCRWQVTSYRRRERELEGLPAGESSFDVMPPLDLIAFVGFPT